MVYVRMCVLDFITTLLPSMTNVDRIWIGLQLTHEKSEWIDQSPVNYVNFNPLLVGMHRSVKINVSSPPIRWQLHHSIITHSSVCFPPLIWVLVMGAASHFLPLQLTNGPWDRGEISLSWFSTLMCV